ncbi:MAG: cupin domain-containing protein [Vulcanimicrobiaceae bacterium]
MRTTSAHTIASATAERGPDGHIVLAGGTNVALRAWRDEEPGEPKPLTTREYDTVGYVLRGRAELHCGGEHFVLTDGDSYFVPRGIAHTYRILESFSAVEATSPPA